MATVHALFVDGAHYMQRWIKPALLRAGDVKIVKNRGYQSLVVYSLFGGTAKELGGLKLLLCGEPNDVSRHRCHFILDCKNVPSRRPGGATFGYLPFYVWSFGERYQNVPKELVQKPDAKVIAKQKTKFCAFMYSQEVDFRNRLFDAVSEYKRVDALGKCRGGPGKDRRHYKPGHSTYLDLAVQKYKPYKFVICCENSRHPGYVTEKIVNAMLAGAIPIYFGAPDVVKHFNPKSFIHVGDFRNYKAAVERVKKVDQNDEVYYSMLQEPWLPHNKLSKYFSPMYLLPFFRKVVASAQHYRHQERAKRNRKEIAARQTQTRSMAAGGVALPRPAVRRVRRRQRDPTARHALRANALGMIARGRR